ncbi:MAG: cysteine desulfurase NifS [Alphaproteobacteria bacterium]|nr:cysteine desulfurase NifS [Alphaproteobacteria bacterium]
MNAASPIYLDNNATTRVDPRVVAEMLPLFTEHWGNPSSLHRFGEAAGERLRAARGQVRALLGAAQDSEIVFTSGGTESNATAILSALEAAPRRREIVISRVEHPSVLSLVHHLERTAGYRVHTIGVDRLGRLDLAAYEAALSPNVAVASIMWANNETGTVFPVEMLAGMARRHAIPFHSDAVQAVGKIPLRLAGSAVDMLSLSGHKLHGPKGVGALYVRRGLEFQPLFRGGHQERGRRAGTENTAGIVGLGKAAELALANLGDANTRVRALRDRLEQGILRLVPDCFVAGDPEARLPNTSTLAFEFVEGEAILLMLNRQGIAASSGSACTSGSPEPSHVMTAMGVTFTAAYGAVRFSLSRYTTEAEVDRVLDALPGVVARQRGASPYWREGDTAARAMA